MSTAHLFFSAMLTLSLHKCSSWLWEPALASKNCHCHILNFYSEILSFLPLSSVPPRIYAAPPTLSLCPIVYSLTESTLQPEVCLVWFLLDLPLPVSQSLHCCQHLCASVCLHRSGITAAKPLVGGGVSMAPCGASAPPRVANRSLKLVWNYFNVENREYIGGYYITVVAACVAATRFYISGKMHVRSTYGVGHA